MDLKIVEDKLQEIVNKVHSDPRKRKIIRYKDRFSMACPYCGDSDKNSNKYRGNLNSALFYKCFNCDCQTHFIQMCKDFSIDIAIDKRMELSNYIHDNISRRDSYNEEYVETNLDKLIDLEKLTEYLNSGESSITNFKPIEKGSVCERYLLKRGLYNGNLINIYEADYWRNSDNKEPIICILNRKGNKLLGMQIRNLKEGKQRTFKIFDFESIHKWLNREEDYLSENEYFSYNRLSLFFGILNVNFDDKITIFEGYLDSLFYPNSIGIVGVNTPTSFLETNGLDIQYFYDNDEAGFIKSEEKIKDGFSIFLWNKLIDYVIKKKNSEDPFSLKNRLDKIKDLNKLATLVKDPYKNLNLQNFFSNDVFDSIWLPKVRKWKKLKFEKR